MSMTFDRELYDKDALFQAIQDYSALARIQVKETALGYVCTFDECRYGPERTVLEFANYVLELTALRGRIC